MHINALQLKIILSILLAVLLLLGLSTQIDESALQTHDATLERALGAFVLAKGLNAVISLLQGTELSFAPVGIGLTLTVGEILDPLNDLVERFSWIMLFATVSLGVQKLLLEFSSLQLITGALALLIGTGFAALWVKPLRQPFLLTLLVRGGLVLLLLRFATIGFIALQTLSFEYLMSERYTAATQHLEQTQAELEALKKAQQRTPEITTQENGSWLGGMFDAPAGLMERAKAHYRHTRELLDMETLSRSLDDVQTYMVDLITIFVVQTILLPLLYLWLLSKLLGWVFQARVEAGTIYTTLLGKKTLT